MLTDFQFKNNTLVLMQMILNVSINYLVCLFVNNARRCVDC